MELIEANAIELLGKGYNKMIVREGYHGGGILLSRSAAVECAILKADIGRVLVFWMGQAEFSYSGEYIVHWA